MTQAPASPSTATPLKEHHLAALRALHADPARTDVESGVLGMLRRRGLVGKVVAKPPRGFGALGQKTTSPLTPAGIAAIGASS